MNDQTSLHTAARRYCQERFAEWAEIYNDLQQKEHWRVEELFEPGWDYSDEAYRTFPRYRIAKNIQVEIERLIPSSVLCLSEMKTQLVIAAERAYASLRDELNNELALTALLEELEDFRAYIATLTSTDLEGVKALPYRRVLNEAESKQHRDELGKIWQIGEGYWFPLKDGPAPSHVLAFHTDYFQSIDGPTLLRGILAARGITKILLLHEFGDPDYEIELACFSPSYALGAEQYSTSQEYDWMVYASHESSITICGHWLTAHFCESHPDCTQRTYQGPYSTSDLRGTWEPS